MATDRKKISEATKRCVLTEAGFRCAVPTCRMILTLDIHHIEEVAEGGRNDPENLVALCPTCHALYTRGVIPKAAIHIYKGMLISLGCAFDKESIDILLFLELAVAKRKSLVVTSDVLLKCCRLISAGLADYVPEVEMRRDAVSAAVSQWESPADIRFNGYIVGYHLGLTQRGRLLVDAWKKGDQIALRSALGPIPEVKPGDKEVAGGLGSNDVG